MVTDGIVGYASFEVVEEQFGNLSAAGVILAVGLFVVALAFAFAAPLWFPRLSHAFKSRKYLRRLASPQFGRILPVSIAFLLFPISGFFSANSLTFWIFLLFGWGFSALLLYYGTLIDSWSSKH